MDEDSPSEQTSLFDEGSRAEPGGSDEPADPAESDPAPDDEEGDSAVTNGGAVPRGDATVSRSMRSPGTPGPPARGRSTFALGRSDRRTTELRVIDDAASPIAGPFRVKAVVRDRDARTSREPSEG